MNAKIDAARRLRHPEWVERDRKRAEKWGRYLETHLPDGRRLRPAPWWAEALPGTLLGAPLLGLAVWGLIDERWIFAGVAGFFALFWLSLAVCLAGEGRESMLDWRADPEGWVYTQNPHGGGGY